MARITTAEMEVKLGEINESIGLLMEMNDLDYRKYWPNVVLRIIELVHTFSEVADELEKTMMQYEEMFLLVECAHNLMARARAARTSRRGRHGH